MFYIIVYGSWGNCIVSEKGEATWDLENAMFFKSYPEACQYINNTWKTWGADAQCFRVYKKGADYDKASN